MVDNPLGLYIGEDVLRLADVGVMGNKLSLATVASSLDTPLFYEIDTEKTFSDEASLIEKMVKANKIKKKNVNIVISDGSSFSQIISMPLLKEKELLSAIKYQADQFIPMPLDQASLDLEVIYEDVKNKSLLVLIVASPSSLVSRVENLIEAAGLIPDTIENELSAVGRLLSLIYKPEAQSASTASLFVNFGFATTSYYLYHHGYNLIVNTHSFKFGFNIFLREIEVNSKLARGRCREALATIGLGKDGSLNIEEILTPAIRELAAETEKFIVAAKEKFNLNSISNVFFFNYASDVRQMSEKMTQSLSLPTSLFDLTPYIVKNPQLPVKPQDLSAHISAIGACIR